MKTLDKGFLMYYIYTQNMPNIQKRGRRSFFRRPPWNIRL